MKDDNLILIKGEKLLVDNERIQYSGISNITIGTGGLGLSNGLGGGLFTSKTIKREGSVLDSRNCHVYLSNKRIIFCDAKLRFLGGKEKSVGLPFNEVYLKNIKGLSVDTKIFHPCINLSVNNNGVIDNVKFWFLGSKSRINDRDNFFKVLKENVGGVL